MLIEYMLSAQSLCELPIPQPECDRIVIGGDVEEEEEEEVSLSLSLSLYMRPP